MISDSAFAGIFSSLESDRVERKRNAEKADEIRQAICAFANDLPGHKKSGFVIIGQEDDGACARIIVDDALMLKVANWRDDGKLLPFPSMFVDRRTIANCTVLVIEVQPSDNPPVRLGGRTWIRIGPRGGIASAEEERRLVEKRRWGNLPFDAQGVPGAAIDDLDLQRFAIELLPAVVPPDILAQNNRTQEQQMRALRLINVEQLPTVTGILFNGISPQSFIRGAYVQFRRIDGTQLTDPTIDQHEITGVLQDQIGRLDDLVSINIRTAATVGGVKRIDQPDYPARALQELIRNGLLHRTYEGSNAPVRVTWYADRVEIQSPGGPFGQVTVENFEGGGETDYRNPTIAEFMKTLGFAERFGMGIAIARNELSRNGNPPLEFQVNPQHVLAIVRARA